MLTKQLEEGRHNLENQYVRNVARQGNPLARQRMLEVFEVADRNWRGIGPIPQSGYRLRPEYAPFDAEKRFGVETIHAPEPPECISAQILQGTRKPTDCPAFGVRCNPDRPLGAPMVSTEGACAAYYAYRRHSNLVLV
jgi:hydrogenase expression/formation protein HypD